MYNFIVATILCVIPLLANASQSEKDLLKTLFRDYDVNVRPVRHVNDTIVVTVKHTIKYVLNIDEHEEFFMTTGWHTLKWNDSYLLWSPKDYDGLESVNISPHMLWIPDIVLYDDIRTTQLFGRQVDPVQNRISIHHDGQVVWRLRALFTTKCNLNMHDFPFDTQQCPIKYGSWSYTKGEIDISPDSMFIVLESAKHFGWYMTNQSVDILSEDFNGKQYEYVLFKLSVRRRALFYSMNLILPPALVTTLILLSFLLPVESGERIALSVTLMLAIIFFVLGITHWIPKGNVTVPIVYRFLVASLFEIFILLFVVTLGMRLYHKEAYDPPMPQWMRVVLLNRLSYWLGTRTRLPPETLLRLKDSDVKEFEPTTMELDIIPSVMESKDAPTKLVASSYVRSSVNNTRTNEEIIKMEWRIVANTVDRIFFIVFFFVILGTIFGYGLTALLHDSHTPRSLHDI